MAKQTEETKLKIKKAMLGRIITWGDKISKSNIGKKVSLETRKKLSDSHKGQVAWNKGLSGYLCGNKHYNWRGGISKINDLCRQIIEYKQWRSSIFERDNWTCQTCNKRGCYLEAHHIKSISKIIKENNIKNLSDAKKCNELWDVNNGVTLCLDCHKLTDNYKGNSNK